MSKPFIFITNDDGINAPGIRALIRTMRKLGKVLVVAPDRPRSGMGHAITMEVPLRLKKIEESEMYTEYACSGTPVDCVKIGLGICADARPDIIVSGINHGANSSINIIYSGTMAAAIEGSIEGIPSVGFSMTDYAMDINFEPVLPFVEKITLQVLSNGLPETVCLNVNMPTLNGSPIKGVKVCRQAHAVWNERFTPRKDPHNKDYFWLSGEFKNLDNKPDTDEYALENGYISVVPIQVDLTAHKFIEQINNWKLND